MVRGIWYYISSMKNVAIRGKFIPKRPNKYKGNVKRIHYRSMWERRFMLYCDRSPNILEWSSEEIHIPYVLDDKHRNYYPDFLVRVKQKDDKEVTFMIEIKPSYQRNWSINKSKWAYARAYCKEHGYEFKVLTEKELF